MRGCACLCVAPSCLSVDEGVRAWSRVDGAIGDEAVPLDALVARALSLERSGGEVAPSASARARSGAAKTRARRPLALAHKLSPNEPPLTETRPLTTTNTTTTPPNSQQVSVARSRVFNEGRVRCPPPKALFRARSLLSTAFRRPHGRVLQHPGLGLERAQPGGQAHPAGERERNAGRRKKTSCSSPVFYPSCAIRPPARTTHHQQEMRELQQEDSPDFVAQALEVRRTYSQ